MLSILSLTFLATILLPDTGSRVCQGGNITMRCRVSISGDLLEGTWRRNGSSLSGNFTSNHFITPFNSTGEGLTDLIITNFRLADSNTEYSCGILYIYDSVLLHVEGLYIYVIVSVYIIFCNH